MQTLAGDYEGSVESFREGLERSPRSPQAALALSIALHSIGDPDADEARREAIDLLPADR